MHPGHHTKLGASLSFHLHASTPELYVLYSSAASQIPQTLLSISLYCWSLESRRTLHKLSSHLVQFSQREALVGDQKVGERGKLPAGFPRSGR